ncbi:formyl transferase [Riemerella anatipestifer]|nr:formyl transferase [Riemerella anatipestifer]
MKIVILSGKGESTLYIYNGIKDDVNIENVIITDSISRKDLLKRRLKKLGYITVINQLIFQLVIVSLLSFFSRKKYNKLKFNLGLDDTPIFNEKIIYTGKVNSNETIQTLKKLNPDLVLVNGTSIISNKVLNSIPAVFINTHVGITPQYRGVHGGYWALYNDDKDNFGVTIHIVDKGIDTGDILYQASTTPNGNDNFITYPLYQYAQALPLIKRAINDFKSDNLKTYKKINSKSKLYYHPTFTQYLFGLIFKGVK